MELTNKPKGENKMGPKTKMMPVSEITASAIIVEHGEMYRIKAIRDGSRIWTFYTRNMNTNQAGQFSISRDSRLPVLDK